MKKMLDRAFPAFYSAYQWFLSVSSSCPFAMESRHVPDSLPSNIISDVLEDGAESTEVIVTQNGDCTLPGFSSSTVSSLAIRVNNYAGLWELVRNSYGGRLVDVLDVKMAG